MCIAKTVLNWAGVLCGLTSAYFWFKASVVVVNSPPDDDTGSGMVYTDPKTGKDVYELATAIEQSRINKIAAIFTGLTVLLQAVGGVLP